jgi:fructose-1-phosphate kinase PfkB-like protein
VTVDESGESVIVYERPGPASDEEYDAFLDLLEHELLPQVGRAIVAGSIPAGIDARGHAAIVEVCRRAGCPLLVDASGAGLVAALTAGPDIVKIGRIEAVEAGIVNDGASALEAAVALSDRGARLAVVTDGAREVAAADATTTWRSSVPRVDAVNAVGSGDSFNAAMSLALLAGADVATALTKGVAAGSANALSLGAAMLDPGVAHQLEDEITLTATER